MKKSVPKKCYGIKIAMAIRLLVIAVQAKTLGLTKAAVRVLVLDPKKVPAMDLAQDKVTVRQMDLGMVTLMQMVWGMVTSAVLEIDLGQVVGRAMDDVLRVVSLAVAHKRAAGHQTAAGQADV